MSGHTIGDVASIAGKSGLGLNCAVIATQVLGAGSGIGIVEAFHER